MKNFDRTTFGELYAENYDAQHDPGTTNAAVALLWELAAERKTLELAIGTGRVALPLFERGLDIHGIEASEKMLSKLRAKKGGASIPVTTGDMADVRVDNNFGFIYLIFNTLFNLQSQDAQVRCFKNTAGHLIPGGMFLVETFVPDVTQFTRGQNLQTLHVDRQSAMLEATVHDPLRQTIDYQRIRITDKGIQLKPLPMRYAWPAEIDLMARLAGLHLHSRWGSWDRIPFTSESNMHISIYKKDEQ